MKPLFLSSVSHLRSFDHLMRQVRLAIVPAFVWLAIATATALHAQVQAVASPAGAASPSATAAASATSAKGDLLAVIKASGKYNTFLKIVDEAGLTATLEQPGPYTIFAPTDDAFSKLPAGTLDRLSKPDSKAKLVALVNYHIAPGKTELAALAKLDELKTLNGEEIDVDTGTDGKTIEMDDSKIIAPDLEATNGVVHGLDAVLQP